MYQIKKERERERESFIELGFSCFYWIRNEEREKKQQTKWLWLQFVFRKWYAKMHWIC